MKIFALLYNVAVV